MNPPNISANDADPTSADASKRSMSRQREQALVRAMLQLQVGIDPDDPGSVLDLTALGFVNNVWRNSPVEDWHSEGRLDDGDMLRINAHTSWRVREIIRRWRREQGIDPDQQLSTWEILDVEDVSWLAVRIWRWLVNPSRQLVTGSTLAKLAGTDLDEYGDHAEQVMSGFLASVEEDGVGYAFWRAAAHGGLACTHWWGAPSWPQLVDRFLHALDTPSDAHWRDATRWEEIVGAAPPQAVDRTGLRRLLTSRPWTLSRPRPAAWCTESDDA